MSRDNESCSPVGPTSEVKLEGCDHEGCQFRHPVGQEEAAPRHLSERQAAAMPCCVLIRIPEGIHYRVQHLICHFLCNTSRAGK